MSARTPRRRLNPLLSSAEVANNVDVLTIGAMRGALSMQPEFRGNAGAGEAIIFADAAGVSAAINARAAESGGILSKCNHRGVGESVSRGPLHFTDSIHRGPLIRTGCGGELRSTSVRWSLGSRCQPKLLLELPTRAIILNTKEGKRGEAERNLNTVIIA